MSLKASFDQDFYAALGVQQTATVDKIKKSYRELAFELHPDHNPSNPDAESIFKAAAWAHEMPSDAQKRAEYDQMRSWSNPPPEPGPTYQAPPPPPEPVRPAARFLRDSFNHYKYGRYEGPTNRAYPPAGIERRRERQNDQIDYLAIKAYLNAARLVHPKALLSLTQESEYADLTCDNCFGSGKVYKDRNTMLECYCVDYDAAPNDPKDHLRYTGNKKTRAFFKLVDNF